MAKSADTKKLGDVLVLGLGNTGESVGRYLAKQLPARVESVTVYGGLDSKMGPKVVELQALGLDVILGTEQVQGHYDLCIVSPGISEFSEFFLAAASHSTQIISEPEFAWRESPQRWIGITGTNGKTTTTTLTCELLNTGGFKAVAVGNIGYMCCDAITWRSGKEWFVAELSSFQLAVSSRLHPRVAILLNISPDHLAWHHTMECYASAKEKIFANLEAGDLAIVGDGDEWCCIIAARLRKRGLRVCTISLNGDPGGPDAAFLMRRRLIVRLGGITYVLPEATNLKIKGLHNIQNALAASACALEVGVDIRDVTTGLLDFMPLEHRIEPCGELFGVSFVDDSKATNTDATEKALSAFAAGSIVLLLGGYDKGTDLYELADVAITRCAAVICYGDAGARLADVLVQREARSAEALDNPDSQDFDTYLDSAGAFASWGVVPPEIRVAEHMADAFDIACSIAQPGQTVLLSPACSSFDEFGGFEERGRVFKDLVRARIATAYDDRY